MHELTLDAPNDLYDGEQAAVQTSGADYTAEALAAIADLDDEGRIDKMMRVGAAIAAAKNASPHGALTECCRTVVKRSESWCSQYWRLYRDRDILQEALDWAARTNHDKSTIDKRRTRGERCVVVAGATRVSARWTDVDACLGLENRRFRPLGSAAYIDSNVCYARIRSPIATQR
jgi:hypothetical protein